MEGSQDNIKQMRVLNSRNFRDLVTQANSLGIQREDVVSIMPTDEELILIYYK